MYSRTICNHVYCKRCRALAFLLTCSKFISTNGINTRTDVASCSLGEENDEGRNPF